MENKQEVSLVIDGQMFKVKKDMLSEHSDYFRAMFGGNYVENEQHEISMDVVDANSMNIILRYMELGLIDISEHSLATVGDLAIAANFLQITELTKQIDYCLEQQLSLSNWMEIKEIAQNAASVKLEQAAVIYGLFSFKSMKPEYVPNINKLFWYLSHPYLDIESELQVFKFGLKWIEQQEMGADALLIILCCLDMDRITKDELEAMKDLTKDYVNSLTEKIIACLHKLAADYELTLSAVKQHKQILCELYTLKVYTEVLNLVKESIHRKLRFTAAVPMWSNKDKAPEKSPNYLFTYTKGPGLQKWMEVAETNLWGWNIASWSPTKIVVLCGEYGRGTGIFMKDVKVYDIHKNDWIQHGVQLPVRRHAGVVVIEDSLYILGGVGAFRIISDSAIIYDLKQRTYRKIAKLPDPVQSPAACVHENTVYVIGHKHIYRYEDNGDHDRWLRVIETDMTPKFLVSFKGYIYVSQCYFPHLYRFRPNVDKVLEQVSCFSQSPMAICNLGNRLLAVTSSGDSSTDIMTVEEYRNLTSDRDGTKFLWSLTGSEYGVNPAGACSVVMTIPPVNPDVSAYHERYLTMYG
ncbi:kelch repeat and BTB domain-containing protein 8 [Helicoverpa armigera]|uniref:kelch repeat and BTB domain-containing protein 8 n=1 Tax=Helicoverpa armigera TaxID=29058 RepID=UPI00308393D4